LGRPSGADHEAQQPGLVGLDAAIMCSGYADEYDCCPPDQLRTTLDRERIERQRRHASRPIPEGFDYGGKGPEIVARTWPLAGTLRALPALASGRLYLRDDRTLVALDVGPAPAAMP
jgi:hypothetical protein